MADSIESCVEAAVYAGKLNGAVICASNTTAPFVFQRTFGEPSATKLLATVATLQCVDAGLLTLDGELSSVAPELTSKQILTGFADDGTPLLEDTSRPITLRMLLSHSSGLSYHFMDQNIARWRESFVGSPTDRRNVKDLFCYPLTIQPGDGWMYGPGLNWVGRIVERVTGSTLGERMQEFMFNPLAVLGGGGEMNNRTIGDFGGHGYFLPGVDFAKVLQSLLQTIASHQAVLTGPAGAFLRVGTEPGAKVAYGLGGVLTLEEVDGWYGDLILTWGGGLTLAWFIDRQNGLCGLVAPKLRF
ncbi:transesterase [Penicillium malachiteum]|uniref:Transesterase n=1 Tax=Penicillium malachiteum TaxID=1324776 RepID=A0AAD6HAA0_9EURO|nr:transesterase [Penicillium malachiteum]